jgi:hypothetical protein
LIICRGNQSTKLYCKCGSNKKSSATQKQSAIALTESRLPHRLELLRCPLVLSSDGRSIRRTCSCGPNLTISKRHFNRLITSKVCPGEAGRARRADALDGDVKRGVQARGVVSKARRGGAGGQVPPVGRHHEEPVAAHGRCQVERRRREREIQLHLHVGNRHRWGSAWLRLRCENSIGSEQHSARRFSLATVKCRGSGFPI